jgi:succinate dehydrogenase/fumarate reductase flavoprotein subunit
MQTLVKRLRSGAHFRIHSPETDDAHWQHDILLLYDNGEFRIETAPT